MRLTHLADYAVVIMTAAARREVGARLSASELAQETGVPLPTTQKLMGRLAVEGLLTSVRGATGGFTLARPAGSISLADVVEAVEGPIAMTVCSGHEGRVGLRARCTLQGQAAHGRRRQCDPRRARRGEPGATLRSCAGGSPVFVAQGALDSCLRRSTRAMTEQTTVRNQEAHDGRREARDLRVGLYQ